MVFTYIFVIALILIVVLGGAILGMVAFFKTDRLVREAHDAKTELARLAGRLAALEKAATAPLSSAPAAVAAPVAAPERRPAIAAPAPEPAAPAPTPSVPPATPGPSLSDRFEELFGGRITVLLGAVALALGGVFLVRYTIEQGLIGPAGRIFAGALFAAVMGAGGEYLRRRDPSARGAQGIAYVPGALTAAAIVTAFATIYAAYGLYGFIGSFAALVLLGLVGFASLAASGIHGPALAALGLAGAFASPLLVGGNSPDAFPLFTYLLIAAFACFFTAHLRGWTWLAIAATVAASAWGLLWLFGRGATASPWALAIYTLALAASAILLLHRTEPERPPAEPGAPLLDGLDRPLTAMLAGPALLAAAFGIAGRDETASLWTLGGFAALSHCRRVVVALTGARSSAGGHRHRGRHVWRGDAVCPAPA